jgi:hypothetical protein
MFRSERAEATLAALLCHSTALGFPVPFMGEIGACPDLPYALRLDAWRYRLTVMKGPAGDETPSVLMVTGTAVQIS